MTKEEIQARLNALPKGNITHKTIKKENGSSYTYAVLQWRENNKVKSRTIKDEEIDSVKAQIEERDSLEKLLKQYPFEEASAFNTTIRIKDDLRSFLKSIKGFNKRSGFSQINDYVHGNEYNKVFILYGLRRTGKTTLIKQVINEMNDEDFNKSAFIQIRTNDVLATLNKDLKELENRGYKYVFIDEVTLMSDFIEGAALLSDIYAASGMKIILSGTDSLGFYLTKSNELYDRCIFLHTTFIPYREFEYVLGIKGIDEYIQYGGTMSLSGTHYNEGTFNNKQSTDQYVDSAIAKNIQHSLKHYDYEGHFRHLQSLYENHELTNAINRVVEDINHRFTIEVLTKEFKSNDLALSSKNLRKDRSHPSTILDDIDIASFTERLMNLLEIKNKDTRQVEVDDEHVYEIKEYLEALDLIQETEIKDISSSEIRKRIVFAQPGLRYSQAKSFVDSLSMDDLFNSLSFDERKRVIDRVLNEIKGRMMEDIVLLETKLVKQDKDVFKLQFASGEIDMVVFDPINGGVELYEIKHSLEIDKGQVVHLADETKCNQITFKYGKIKKKSVIYRGDSAEVDGISYQNVEDYLNSLE
ncbi:MAG: AAA family ATPase [Bacilli bacterium]|nr:AAA family ATPase [Bacilli bacterium]